MKFYKIVVGHDEYHIALEAVVSDIPPPTRPIIAVNPFDWLQPEADEISTPNTQRNER